VKILILNLNFAPELTGMGKFGADLGAWLSDRGHVVRVIAARPHGPESQVEEGDAGWGWRRESRGAVEALRWPVWRSAAATALARVLCSLSRAASSFVSCLWQAARFRPDLIWTGESIALAAPTVLLAARLCGARACLHVRDLEAQAVRDSDPAGRPRPLGVWRGACGWLVRRFDLVSTICIDQEARLRRLGVGDERLCLFPNWVDTTAIRPLAGPSRLRRRWGLADDLVVALYAGAMDERRGVEVLLEVAGRLRAHPRIRLVLCGNGAARARLERRTAGCANIALLPLPPETGLNELLNAADIHLLPRQPEAATSPLPFELAGMLASGRPVVAQAAGGELAAATRRCGILAPPGDAGAMADAILELAADPARRGRLGEVARQLAEEHLQRDAILARYEQRLLWLVSLPGAGQRRRQARHQASVPDRLIGRTPTQLRRG
jgi:colanic acid biosynthesis glycosyl transferase WcaI